MTQLGPFWLIAVDGEDRGDAHCIEPGGEVSVGLHKPIGPFRVEHQGLSHPLSKRAKANLFGLCSESPIPHGDVIELDGQMWLVSHEPPGWPTALLAECVDDGSDQTTTPAEVSPANLEQLALHGASEEEVSMVLSNLWISPPVAIPRIFQSVYHAAPFPTCLMCDAQLLEGEPRSYMIEKIYQGQEVVMECAVCHGCAMSMNDELSEESRLRLESFSLQMLEQEATLQRCRICRTERNALSAFNTITTGLFDRVLPDSWVLLCEECTGQMESLLERARVWRDGRQR